jgi:hypothetical protein
MAGDLPARLGSELSDAARVAFSHGLDTAALGAAFAMVVAAAFCARFFRGVRVVPEGADRAVEPATLLEPTATEHASR